MTKPWDKYREIIIAEYKEQNRPLHEVQRIMKERYGFKASTRAYRSRFDRWGIHKYSRRRQCSVAGDAVRLPVQQSSDVEESSSQAASPIVSPLELLNPSLCEATPSVGFRSSLCLKAEFPYGSVTPSPISAVDHSPASSNQFGIQLGCPFNSQNLDCYSAGPTGVYRQAHHVPVIADSSLTGQGSIPQIGIQAGYAYSLGLVAGSRG